MLDITRLFKKCLKNPYGFLAYLIIFFVFIIYLDAFIGNDKFNKFSLKEVSSVHQSISKWGRDPSVAYKLITNDNKVIKLVGIPSFINDIKPNDDFFVLKSRFLKKNIKLKLFNKGKIIEENISILNTLLFKIFFFIILSFHLQMG